MEKASLCPRHNIVIDEIVIIVIHSFG